MTWKILQFNQLIEKIVSRCFTFTFLSPQYDVVASRILNAIYSLGDMDLQ